jgi:DNA-binding HxlR family transcriptional regulator
MVSISLKEKDMIDLKNMFIEFGEICASFSSNVYNKVGLESIDLTKFFDANMRISRTIFKKWGLEILIVLYTFKEVRYRQFLKILPNISTKVLSERLKELEKANLIKRDIEGGRPPAVKCSLTEQGNLIVKMGEPIFLYLGFVMGFYTNKKD